MRAGTQTLIQALQALPWMSDNDDESHNDPGVVESESEDEERPQCEIYVPFSHFYLLSPFSGTIIVFHPYYTSAFGPI